MQEIMIEKTENRKNLDIYQKDIESSSFYAEDAENINSDVENLNKINNHCSTYIEIITEKNKEGQPTSFIEVDLVISREKGRENRSLSINFAGVNVEKQTIEEKSVHLNKEAFEELKKFFTELDWNS